MNLKRFYNIKMLIFPKLSVNLMQLTLNILTGLFMELNLLILNYIIWKTKGPNIYNNSEKEKIDRKLILSQIKTNYNNTIFGTGMGK